MPQVTFADITLGKVKEKRNKKIQEEGKKEIRQKRRENMWWLCLWKQFYHLSADSQCHNFHINSQSRKLWIKKTAKNTNQKLNRAGFLKKERKKSRKKTKKQEGRKFDG